MVMRIARTCGPCDEGMHEQCLGNMVSFASDKPLIACECDHDDYLAELLQQSVSQFTTVCTDARYGVMLDYHQLERLRRSELFGGTVAEQIAQAHALAEADHERHVEHGTCIKSQVPRNSRTKQWEEEHQ